MKPIKMGPAESLLYSQGIYSDFAGDYFQRHGDQRDILRDAAKMERQLRDGDPTFAQGSFGSATSETSQCVIRLRNNSVFHLYTYSAISCGEPFRAGDA